jgi:multicomponent K+:H+ antiporter subunit D
MNHLVVMPILLPALTAGLLLLLGDRLALARMLGLVSTTCFFLISMFLVMTADAQGYQVYALGDWPAPFGIVMVLDRLSALLILLTSLVALAALVYAVQGWDARGKFFHALFQFQLMGLSGAFLTGDLFNLFVFFEVLLIASYCLLLHGLGQRRLKAAVHYVAINLTGSAVFLIAVSLLYGVTGSLNMAHLAERVAQASQDDIALIRAAGLMLLGVFGVKAALFPLYFWLPSAYSNAAAPVAALFAIMTKVGVYAIIRVSGLIFGETAIGGDLLTPWLLPVALVTLGLAAFGALSARRFSELVAYLTVASVGTMLSAYAAGGEAGLASALFYLVHSTLAVAAMFLLAEILGKARGSLGDRLESGPALWQPMALGISFLVGGAILAGLPLSSGFLAKLMILRSVSEASGAAWIWLFILGASLMTLIGLARAGSLMIWNVSDHADGQAQRARPLAFLPFMGLLGCSLLMVFFASPLKAYLDHTAAQIKDPSQYIRAAIGETQDAAPRRLQSQATK